MVFQIQLRLKVLKNFGFPKIILPEISLKIVVYDFFFFPFVSIMQQYCMETTTIHFSCAKQYIEPSKMHCLKYCQHLQANIQYETIEAKYQCLDIDLFTLGACAEGLRYLVCVSVCYHTSCYIINSKQKTRCHRLLYGVFLDFDSRISPKRLHSGAMAIFASVDDRGSLLSIEITPAVLDTARIDSASYTIDHY